MFRNAAPGCLKWPCPGVRHPDVLFSALSRNRMFVYASSNASLIPQALRMAERAELGNVATEEEGGRPVGDDAELP